MDHHHSFPSRGRELVQTAAAAAAAKHWICCNAVENGLKPVSTMTNIPDNIPDMIMKSRHELHSLKYPDHSSWLRVVSSKLHPASFRLLLIVTLSFLLSTVYGDGGRTRSRARTTTIKWSSF